MSHISVSELLSCEYFKEKYIEKIRFILDQGVLAHKKICEHILDSFKYDEILIEKHYSIAIGGIVFHFQPDVIIKQGDTYKIIEIKPYGEKKVIYPYIQLSFYKVLFDRMHSVSSIPILLFYKSVTPLRYIITFPNVDIFIVERNIDKIRKIVETDGNQLKIIGISCKYCPEKMGCKPNYYWRSKGYSYVIESVWYA